MSGYVNYAYTRKVWDLAPRLRSDGLGSSDLLTLLAVARHASDFGQSFPSQLLLASETLLSPRTVWTSLQALTDKGYLLIDTKRGRANGYQLNLPVTDDDGAVDPPTSEPPAAAATAVAPHVAPAAATATAAGEALALRFFEYQGKPAKWQKALPGWGVSFDRLLQQYSLADITECLNWAFNIDTFWPDKLIRADKDPLAYFVSKVDDLVAKWRGYRKSKTNSSAKGKPSTRKSNAMVFKSAV